MVEIRELAAAEIRRRLDALADILLDCVAGGASVSFMASLSKAEALAFFESVVAGVERQDRILLAAFIDFQLVGTVQILTAMPPNQPHRADISKLLVHRSSRGQGIGSRLMRHVEKVSMRAGKTLLVLDAVTGGAGERLYLSLGWQRAGVIPRYALYPDGTWCDTTYLYKELSDSPR